MIKICYFYVTAVYNVYICSSLLKNILHDCNYVIFQKACIHVLFIHQIKCEEAYILH